MALYIDTTSYTSPNCSKRPTGVAGVISAVVVHTGEGTKKSDLQRLCDDSVQVDHRVSAHYYVDRALNVYQLVDPANEAWHAGESDFQGRQNWNTFSIGIESEHKKGQTWAVGQKDMIGQLTRDLIDRYHIKQPWIAAHRWIAPNRKFDPTDWPNPELNVWINNLYVQPNYEIEGPSGPMTCGKGFYDFYHMNGDFALFGFALTNEAKDIDTLGRECTWMRFERVVFKYVYGEGVHLALLVEAATKKWLV